MFLKTLKSLSLRTRLTALFALIFGTTSIVFTFVVYYFLNDSLLQDFDDALYNYAIDVAQTIEIGPKNDLLFPPLHVDEGKIFPFSSGNSLILVRHKSGEILVQTGRFGKFKLPFKDEIKQIRHKGKDSAYTTLYDVSTLQEPEASAYRLITFPLEDIQNPTLFLQIAVPMTTFEKQLDRLSLIALIGIPAVLLLAIILGFYFSSRALQPVKEIILKTQSIDASNLKERVPLPAGRDEIRSLAETQNQMLERIERAFQSQERFVSDASHQILTPLTILRGEVEQKIRDNPADKNFFVSQLQEIDKLTRITQDMLLLARIDSGVESLMTEKFNIDEVLIDVIGHLQKIAFNKNISLKFDMLGADHRQEINGDPDLIRQLFTNLIENAIKYSPNNEVINVRVTWTLESTVVEVIDHGPGIPTDQRRVIFERFSRLNPSDGRKGFGLGLAIAKQIANLHGFDLSVLSILNDQKDSSLVHTDTSAKNGTSGQVAEQFQKGSVFKLEIKNI